MDKAGSEGKPWISGLYEYRVTPQSGSIASPLQLLTQCTPREKDLPQLPSTLGAHEMYDTHQEILKRQPDRPERSYIELTPGMAVWVQHKQNTSWEPAIIASQISPNSYWIMQENGNDQPKLYRWTRSMLKIRCTEVRTPNMEYSRLTESHKAKFHSPYTLNEERNNSSTILSMKYQEILSSRQNQILPLCLILYFQKERRKMQILQKKHLQKHLHLHLHLQLHPHWRQSSNDHTLQDQESQHARTLGDQPVHTVTSTCETSFHPGLLDTQYNVLTFAKLVNKAVLSFSHNGLI